MDTKSLKLKLLLDELEKITGRGTELVSYYIPAGYDLPKVLDHLSYEYSTAQNIKDKTTRKNVMDAIAKVLNYLKGLKKTPKNGLVVFCGNIAQKPGEQDIRLWAIEPPEPINIRIYRCDSKFVIDPLKELFEPKQVYGLIVLDRGEATIGLLKGKKIVVLENRESWVPGKHRAGGQSSVRFQRLWEQDVHEWMKYVADKARKYFERYDNLIGILIGGPGPLKDKFYEGDYLPYHLKQKVLAVIDTGYSNEYGLKELVEKAKDVLEKTEYINELKLLERFFAELSKGSDLLVYGYQDVKQALEMGAAETVLVSEDFPEDKLKEIVELAEQTSANVEIISKETPEGEQFANFKIAAFLRYRI